MHRVLILGSAGQLGVELVNLLAPEADLVALARHEVDLADEDALRTAIRNANPAFLVNAAAYTAVDRAESEPELARAVNAIAPRIMAEESLRLNACLVHFSTDYVFNGSGTQPWRESDAPHPLNVYGQTKLEGEQAIAASGCRHFIFRTSWVFSAHGNNFLNTMLRLGAQRPSLNIVDDQIGAPTSTGELARAVQHLHRRLQDSAQPPPESGVYHMACAGETSWFGFAEAIFSAMPGHGPALQPISSDQYKTPAVRPRNSRLNCDKLQHAMGIRLAPWEVALADVIRELQASIR